MATKPNEIRHSQVSCELENYCLQRGQSLAYSVDLNSESVDQLTDSDVVENVDSDPSVSITLDSNEFGSTLLYTILSGRYEGYPDETFSVSDIQSNPVDLLVSVKENSSATVANRSAWFNYCFVDSISGSYQVDSFASESVSLSGNSLRWYSVADSTEFGATKILKFNNSDGTGAVDTYFDDPTILTSELHALTEDGLIIPSSKYVFNQTTHSVVPNFGSDFSFTDEGRYRGIIYNRPELPTPNDVNDPIGGLVAKEIEVVMWDSNVDPIDWKTSVGTATMKQALRVQSFDYEISFDREVLKQTMTGLYSQSVNSTSITATVALNDSDLEHWARMSGNWSDYTTGNLDSVNLSQFQNMSSLSCRLDLFNTKDPLNHTAATLLKQLYFTGGKITSIGDSRDVPGRGTQTFEIRFDELVIRGTGAQGRTSSTLWSGKEFAFVFMSDDNISHNIGWAEEAEALGVPITIAMNSYTTTPEYRLSQEEMATLYASGHGFINHGLNHCTKGWEPDNAQEGYGSFGGYHYDASGWDDLTPNSSFADWDEAQPFYLGNMDRHILTLKSGSNTTLPYMPFDDMRHGAFPNGPHTLDTIWDLYRSGYRGWRGVGGIAHTDYSITWPNSLGTGLISSESMMLFPIQTSINGPYVVGGPTDVYSESAIKANIAEKVEPFKSGGTEQGGIAIIFTHSYGTDISTVGNPAGWPPEDGEEVPWYADGIRKNEVRWILEEAIAQNAKVLTFPQAVNQIWERGHYVENPEEVYGQDYTDAIIFASGAGDKYPSGYNYDDLLFTSNDFLDHFDITYHLEYSASTLSYASFPDMTAGDDRVFLEFSLKSGRSTDISTFYIKDTGLITSSAVSAYSNGEVIQTDEVRTWNGGDTTFTFDTQVSLFDITGGHYNDFYIAGDGHTTEIYSQIRLIFGGDEFHRGIRRKSDLIYTSYLLRGVGGLIDDLSP